MRKLFNLPILLSITFLAGCGKTQATPALDIDGTFTAVANTMAVSFPTSSPVTQSTPNKTSAPIISTATQLPQPSPANQTNTSYSSLIQTSSACDNAAFVSDITIEDGTQLSPDEVFEKTWELSNAGTCTWDESYALTFVSGSQMNGSDTSLDESVSPGESVEITVEMTAPSTEASYTGYWRMTNADGTLFGDTIYVQVEVTEDAATATPTEEATEEEEDPTSTPEPTSTPVPTATPVLDTAVSTDVSSE
jgi:hypothetical protein